MVVPLAGAIPASFARGATMAVRIKTDLIVIHVSATPPSRDIGAAEIDAMHKAEGWNGIGYHYVIRRNGEVEAGRPIDQVGAHVGGWNSVSIGICLVGGINANGIPQDNRTPEQTSALVGLLRDLLKTFKTAKICGHRDLSPDKNRNGRVDQSEFIKACPCFDAIPWARANGLPAADIRGYWDQKAPAIETIKAPDARKVYLQRLLAGAGFTFGPIDGQIGPRTMDAIKAFQRRAGLPETGDFDAATVKRLRAEAGDGA